MMGRRGVAVFSRPLVYRNKTVQVPGMGAYSFLAGEEKGIDVRLALDALDVAHRDQFDVALIFSQDQDLSELASLIRQVAGFQNRWIKIASAFPDSPAAVNRRGSNCTDWYPNDKATYDACIRPAWPSASSAGSFSPQQLAIAGRVTHGSFAGAVGHFFKTKSCRRLSAFARRLRLQG